MQNLELDDETLKKLAYIATAHGSSLEDVVEMLTNEKLNSLLDNLHTKCKQCKYSTNDFFSGFWCKEMASRTNCTLSNNEVDFLTNYLVDMIFVK